MEKNWILKSQGDGKLLDHLCSEFGIARPLATLLVQRGVTTFDEARSFFRPDLSDLHDPFLMKDMEEAVSRIQIALQNKEKILIYGDYDVDGTTSVALVYNFFKSIKAILAFSISALIITLSLKFERSPSL